MSARRGLYGGTFDPPHRGHLHVVECAHSACDLDYIHVIPAACSPHKSDQSATSPEHRWEMVRRFCQANLWLHPDDRELRRGGLSYTIDTVEDVQRQYPDDELLLLIGLDSLSGLASWWRVHDLLKMVTVVTVWRDDTSCEDVEAWLSAFEPHEAQQLRAHLLTVSAVPASSTEIRRALRAGVPTAEDWLDPLVARYITEQRLYRSP